MNMLRNTISALLLGGVFPLFLSAQQPRHCPVPAPVLFAEPLTCVRPSTQLFYSALPKSVDVSWSGPGLSEAQMPPPMVSQPGWYYAHLRENATGCSRIDSVYVEDRRTVPTAAITAENLHFNLQAIPFSALQSTHGPDILYHWWSEDPSVHLSRPDSPTVLATGTGTIHLRVTDRRNGCSSVASTAVGPPKFGDNPENK